MPSINSIEDILNDPEFDSILVPEPAKTSTAKTSDDRLVESFLEINQFYQTNQQTPNAQSKDINERKLNARLEGFKQSPDKVTFLKSYDEYNLPPTIPNVDTNLENVLNEDEQELDIFKIEHIPTAPGRLETDFVARRKPCKDFDQFEPLFRQCHQKLKSGKFKLVKFSESNLEEGVFYVMKGILMYLEKFESEARFYRGEYRNNRTRIIFENGTESNMLKRSMVTALSKDGKKVISLAEPDLYNTDANNLQTGYIYILKSLSKNPEIYSIQNLYKIGYATTSVQDRIKNAKTDPTYLNAEVKIVATFQTIDLNPQKLENLLHRFFADSCLDIFIDDGKGVKYKPREWFIAPFVVIDEAVQLILNGNIVDYRYNPKSEKIELVQV